MLAWIFKEVPVMPRPGAMGSNLDKGMYAKSPTKKIEGY